VTITLKSPLSSDVLENNAVISVGIKATQDTDEATATLVVKLPKQQGSFWSFSQTKGTTYFFRF
jgi:hypothetical protein